MEPDDDYSPGPEERLDEIMGCIYWWDHEYDRQAILDIIFLIFEEGYQDGYADAVLEIKGG